MVAIGKEAGMDLLDLIPNLRRVASTNGGEYAGPCPFCGGRDRFRVWPERGRWWCRQCRRSGDAITLLRERDGLSFREALERLGEYRPSARPVAIVTTTAPRGERPAWDAEAVQALVAECETALFSPAGEKARNWLHGRGLTDATLKAWRIGYNPADRKVRGVYIPRGIVIPCYVDNALQYVKVRRPVPPLQGPKYQMLTGSKGALFGLDRMSGKTAVVICEAELDAILLHQEAGDLVDVVALGSKGVRPALEWLTRLARASQWLVALDRDADDAATWWEVFSARVRRVRPLQGNDLTEFHQAGGDLRAWVEFHLAALDAPAQSPAPSDDTIALVLRAVRELGAVCITGDFEAQAEALLACCDGSVSWARRWAVLAEAAGWPCYGFPSWAAWAADVALFPGRLPRIGSRWKRPAP